MNESNSYKDLIDSLLYADSHPTNDPFKQQREQAKAEGNLEYDNKYDAYYHKLTNEWLEEICGHSDCEFCGKRPDKHISQNI